MSADLGHSLNSIGKRLCMQNIIMPLQMLKALESHQVSVGLPRLNAETRGKLADKCHHKSNRVSFFS